MQKSTGLEAAAGKAFGGLEPRVAGKVSARWVATGLFFEGAQMFHCEPEAQRHRDDRRNKPLSTAKPLKAADSGLAPSKLWEETNAIVLLPLSSGKHVKSGCKERIKNGNVGTS